MGLELAVVEEVINQLVLPIEVSGAVEVFTPDAVGGESGIT